MPCSNSHTHTQQQQRTALHATNRFVFVLTVYSRIRAHRIFFSFAFSVIRINPCRYSHFLFCSFALCRAPREFFVSCCSTGHSDLCAHWLTLFGCNIVLLMCCVREERAVNRIVVRLCVVEVHCIQMHCAHFYLLSDRSVGWSVGSDLVMACTQWMHVCVEHAILSFFD